MEDIKDLDADTKQFESQTQLITINLRGTKFDVEVQSLAKLPQESTFTKKLQKRYE